MQLISSKSTLKGTITIPASKSHTIRALVFASLAKGTSTVINPLVSRDTKAALNAVKKFGVRIKETNEDGIDIYEITGLAGNLSSPDDVIDVMNSGTTLYILLSMAALNDGYTVITGDGSIRTRPCDSLLSALNELGAQAFSTRKNGYPPIIVRGKMKGGTAHIDAITSQYVTSLLIACPLLSGDTEIIVGNLNEVPYIQMTLSWLDFLGIKYSHDNFISYRIKGNQKYESFSRTVPGDFSSATFFLCAGAMIPGSHIILNGLDINDTQGDKAVIDYLRKMGADITVDESENTITVKGGQLKGCELDLNKTPDALPAMAVAACSASGETRLVNVAQARVKETDRISVMKQELTKLGATVQERDDGLIIQNSRLKGSIVNSHDDHRVAMACAIAGFIADGKTTINDAEAIDVTFPTFNLLMDKLGANLSLHD